LPIFLLVIQNYAGKVLKVFLAFFLLLTLTFPVYSQVGFHLINGKKKSRIPFELVNNLPLVKVNVNGTGLSFILDTGVKSTILFGTESNSILKIETTSPVKIHGLGPDGFIWAKKSEKNTIKIGNAIDEEHVLFAIFDVSLNFSARMGVPIDGVLGSEFFKNFIVKIDYISRMITIYDPVGFSVPKSKKWKEVPLNLVSDKPYIDLTISSEKSQRMLTLLVDSGSSDVLWLFDEDDFIKEAPKNYFQDFLGLGFSGNIYGKRSRIPKLSLGEFNLNNVSTSFPEDESTTSARRVNNRSGSVGGGFLRRFTVIFDYGRSRALFKRNRNFSSPFYYNMSGLTLEQSGTAILISDKSLSVVPRYIVVDVRDHSPAQLAGVEKYDEILSINGRPNYDYKLYELSELFSSKEEKKITLEIKRGERDMKIKFYLKKMF